MLPRVSSSCRLAVAILSIATASRAATPSASRSPFLPPQTAATTAPTNSAPLQFVGYLDTGTDRLFRIHDPAKKASTWVKLNERDPDFDVVAKQHNDDSKTLTIEHGGQALTLALREPKIVSSGNAAQAVPPPPMPVQANVAPAVTQSVVLNPTPADEQRRLEAVAAEVARRRALREQAAQQINRGVQPQVAVPQPPQRNYQQQNVRQRGQRQR